jgi:predicted dehydrogenase
MAGESTIQVALVGYGLGGRSFHAPLIGVTPGLRLHTIVTSDAERQRAALAECSGARVVATADALFAHAHDIDLVVISTPNRTHVPLAEAAIAAGKAVVVDKPMAPTSTEARQLIADAKMRGVFLSVYQNRRWDGDFLTLRRLIRDDALGRVLRFESRFDRWRPAPKGGWREQAEPAEAGGLLYDIGSHLIDQALTLFGPVDNVYAELDSRRANIDVDDDVFVALEHRSGVRSHLWATVMAAQSGPRLRVLGNKAAYIKQQPDVQETALRRGERPSGSEWGVDPREHWGRLGTDVEWTAIPTDRGAYQDYYGGVVQSLRDGAPPPVDPADAVATLEIIEWAQRVGRRV